MTDEEKAARGLITALLSPLDAWDARAAYIDRIAPAGWARVTDIKEAPYAPDITIAYFDTGDGKGFLPVLFDLCGEYEIGF